ncbi:MAG TPA: PAS domain S-box protein [Accumulibacter sp.]|nr:PAS domain S-box protein [Accumulibacter sp.]HMW16530.1 PAS domain S-box protein [Accumulibacter sp.]HMX21366.1 PAS domain S-box protein [Accumulibacter sp.]HNC18643.1 PAS domain S-box protein [Accumulibacter sp.]HND78972.1 PAS domain S-box protein [Accumulibacter sp.]
MIFDNLRKYSIAYLVAIGGVLLTCLSSWNVRQELQSSHYREFEWAAGDRIQAVRLTVDQGLDALLEVREIYHAARSIKELEFRVLTDTLLKRRGYIHSLFWATWTPSEQGRGGARRTLPVRLSASRAGADYAIDVDLQADRQLADLFDRATASGKVAVSGRKELRLPGKPALQVIYAALPVYATQTTTEARPDDGQPVIGFLVGIYVIEDLIHSAISLLEPRGVDVLVSDVTGNETQFLHHYGSRLGRGTLPAREEEQSQKVATIDVGDRSWAVRCVATDTFRSAEVFNKAHWTVLIGGLLFSGLLSLYLARNRRELDNRAMLNRQIREREEIFRQLAETVDVVFWATSADACRLEYIGPAFRQLAGGELPPDDASATRIFDIFAPEERQILRVAVDRLLRDGRRFNVVLPLRDDDQVQRWLRVCGFPVRQADGSLARLVGFFEDITEHKLTEDALRDSETKLRTLFNHSPDLIFTVDREANIVLANRHFPYPVGGTGEQRSEAILPPQIRERYLECLTEVFASSRVEHFQYQSGDATWWEIRIVPIASAKEVLAAMVVLTDITENRKLQWQAIRSARLASLGVLSAGIAHEINNPNHAILANASLLARVWRDALPILDEYEQEQGSFVLAGLQFAQASEIVSRGMTDIADNARRIQRIIDNLKHLGKQDLGHMDERVNVRKVLQAAAGLLDSRIRKHTDRFTLDLPDTLPWVQGNIQQLEQVFINVIINALESLPERDRAVKVSAGTSADGRRVMVAVEDEGRGIGRDVLANIGEPFLTTKAEQGGTGLGLSISTSIVERHAGVMKFASRGQAGTQVTIELPAIVEG